MLLQDLVQQEETLKRRSQQRKLTVQVQVLNLLQPRISMDTIKVKLKLKSGLPSHQAVVVLRQPVEVPNQLVKIHG